MVDFPEFEVPKPEAVAPASAIVPVEMQMQIAEWRRKAIDGSLSEEEMRQAIIALRGHRVAAAATSAKARKPAKVAPNSDDLLAELEGL